MVTNSAAPVANVLQSSRSASSPVNLSAMMPEPTAAAATPPYGPAPTELPGFAPEPAAEAAPAPRRSLEETIGTRWTVWVGGAALALGALLLVRYSIERGFFGPGVRMILGLLLAAALIGAGEFLRRRETAPSDELRFADTGDHPLGGRRVSGRLALAELEVFLDAHLLCLDGGIIGAKLFKYRSHRRFPKLRSNQASADQCR